LYEYLTYAARGASCTSFVLRYWNNCLFTRGGVLSFLWRKFRKRNCS